MATTMRTMICALIFLTSLSGHVPEGRPAEPSGNPGWEAEWERTIKAAEQEGEVSFYTLGDFLLERLREEISWNQSQSRIRSRQ